MAVSVSEFEAGLVELYGAVELAVRPGFVGAELEARFCQVSAMICDYLDRDSRPALWVLDDEEGEVSDLIGRDSPFLDGDDSRLVEWERRLVGHLRFAESAGRDQGGDSPHLSYARGDRWAILAVASLYTGLSAEVITVRMGEVSGAFGAAESASEERPLRDLVRGNRPVR